MKTDPCCRSVRLQQFLLCCIVATGIWTIAGSAGLAAAPEVDIAVSSKKAATRLRLEVNVVEYPVEKGIEVFRLMGLAHSPAALTIDTPRVAHTGPVPEKPTTGVSGISGSETTPTWILNKGLNEFILDKLKESEDAQVIAGPRVLAPEGESTKLEFKYPGEIVTHLGPGAKSNELMETPDDFPTLYLEPKVAHDGNTIGLKATQTIRDFVGYDLDVTRKDVWDYVESSGANPAPTSPGLGLLPISNPKPLYRFRQVTGTAAVGNGQTLVLSGLTSTTLSKTNVPDPKRVPLLGDLPIAGKLFQTRTIPREQKKLLLFITPTLLDEDGKPVQPEKAPEDVTRETEK